MTTAADLYEVFEPEARRAFSFLEEQYGFVLRDVEKFEGSALELTYVADRVAVVVMLEPPESSLDVGLVEFPDGRVPSLPSAQMIGLTEIMRRQGAWPAPAIVERRLMPGDLPRLLDESAKALRRYAEPALRGDTTLLEEVRASRYTE